MKKAIFFDLDGTLLPMDLDTFTNGYFKLLVKKMIPYNYDSAELIKHIWGGTKAMVCNDGSVTNEKAFWNYFTSVYGEEKLKDVPVFEDFYENDFQGARELCGFQPKAAQIVNYIKEKGLKIVLATNPIFPKTATKSRIEWAGLKEDDFEFYTTYENSTYSKPNVEYYEEVLKKAGVTAEEVLMVGNDTTEDLAAARIGIDVFILTDCLIDKENVDLSEVPHGNFDELKKYIDNFII